MPLFVVLKNLLQSIERYELNGNFSLNIKQKPYSRQLPNHCHHRRMTARVSIGRNIAIGFRVKINRIRVMLSVYVNEIFK